MQSCDDDFAINRSKEGAGYNVRIKLMKSKEVGGALRVDWE